MKRHPALRALSSDHHQGLVQARRLVQAAESAPADAPALTQAAAAFLAFWEVHINRHFREEEEALLPAFARYGDPAAAPVVRLLVEHVQIRRLVDDLRDQLAADRPQPETMSSLGALLRGHIRHEEDIVFPLIEQVMPEAALVALARQLTPPDAAPA